MGSVVGLLVFLAIFFVIYFGFIFAMDRLVAFFQWWSRHR